MQDRPAAPSVFLERSSYRRRRLMDAQRLLPVLGLILWMVPLLWPTPADTDAEPVLMSEAIYYVFGVWVFLIVLGAVMWRQLGGSDLPGAPAATDADTETGTKTGPR